MNRISKMQAAIFGWLLLEGASDEAASGDGRTRSSQPPWRTWARTGGGSLPEEPGASILRTA